MDPIVEFIPSQMFRTYLACATEIQALRRPVEETSIAEKKVCGLLTLLWDLKGQCVRGVESEIISATQ